MTLRPLVLAVPSKGRLQENSARFFARAGLDLVQGRGARDYRGTLAGFSHVEVAYLPASDIVSQLADGAAHFGIAGEDLLREQVRNADARVTLLAPLGFGNANVVVAVPQAWIDVRTTADLEDVAAIFHARRGRRMRVATKYIHLTRAFLAEAVASPTPASSRAAARRKARRRPGRPSSSWTSPQPAPPWPPTGSRCWMTG